MIEDEPERRAAASEIARRMAPHVLPDARFDLDLAWFIPGFAEADAAAARLAGQVAYRRSRALFVTPDNGLAPLRAMALRDGKTIVLPTYGLRRGFVAIDGSALDPALALYASWLDGLETFARPVSLAELAGYRLDLVVTAASAISTAGQRFGMGANYLDLEYPILAALGAVTPETPIAAIVHDAQLWPGPLPLRHSDVPASLIVTPTTSPDVVPLARPTAIDWSRVDAGLERAPYFADLLRLAARP